MASDHVAQSHIPTFLEHPNVSHFALPNMAASCPRHS